MKLIAISFLSFYLYGKLRERARWTKSLAVICYPSGQDIYLIRRFVVYYRWVFLLVVCILTRPTGSSKYGTTRKNTQRYYTTKRLIRDLLSNTPNCLVRVGQFSGYLFTGNAWQKYAKRKGIGAGNPANWLVNSRRTRQTGFYGFDHAITGAIYFTFHNGKKSSLDRPSYTSIQVFHFKICDKKKGKKEIRFD